MLDSPAERLMINSGPVEPPPPSIRAYMYSCSSRREICEATIQRWNATDWNGKPLIVWDHGTGLGTPARIAENAYRMIQLAADDSADYGLFLEDDLLFNLHLFHNLSHWWPLRNGWLWMASLYNPGIAPAPDADVPGSWHNRFLSLTPSHFFGAQALVLSRQAMREVLSSWDPRPHWDNFLGSVATNSSRRVITHVPSLVQHVPVSSTWGGCYHRASDFDPFFRADSASSLAASEHFYEWIPGWFDYQDLYAEMVRTARDHARFVEVGAWFGRSTAFLAAEIKRSRKPIQFHVVDHWEGGKNEPDHAEVRKHTDVFDEFERNMRQGGVRELLHVHREDSVAVAARFPDQSLDFVFLDGSHDFESVQADVIAWKAKIRPGGVLAGHDWGRFEVQPAVLSQFDLSELEINGYCWSRRF